MVIVMPAFTKTEQANKPFIVAPVVCLELTLPKSMTYRIDAPGNMVCEEDAHKSAPQETCPATNQERDNQRQCHPQQKCAADKDNDRIFDKIATIHIGISHRVSEQPAHMSMKKTFDGAMRVPFTIRMSMMLDMRCRP